MKNDQAMKIIAHKLLNIRTSYLYENKRLRIQGKFWHKISDTKPLLIWKLIKMNSMPNKMDTSDRKSNCIQQPPIRDTWFEYRTWPHSLLNQRGVISTSNPCLLIHAKTVMYLPLRVLRSQPCKVHKCYSSWI